MKKINTFKYKYLFVFMKTTTPVKTVYIIHGKKVSNEIIIGIKELILFLYT